MYIPSLHVKGKGGQGKSYCSIVRYSETTIAPTSKCLYHIKPISADLSHKHIICDLITTKQKNRGKGEE